MRTENFILFSTVALCAVGTGQNACAQSASDGNRVITTEALTASYSEPTGANARTTEVYYDGLGRQISTVRKKNKSNVDLADYIEYDNHGRIKKEYLPISVPSSSSFMGISSFNSEAQSYHEDAFPYTEKTYDSAGKVIEEFGPGQRWREGQGHSIKHIYLTNEGYGNNYVNQDSYNYAIHCKRFSVSTTGSLRAEDDYLAATLRVDLSYDEDGHATATFTDKNGKTLLVRKYEQDGYTLAETYYVYDIYGRLRYVLSPKACEEISELYNCDVPQDVIDKLSYKYDYDERDRCVMKKLPGVGEVYYVYDKLNQVIFSQNVDQRTRSEWSVTKRDSQNRVAVTGRAVLAGATRQSLQLQWGNTLLTAEHNPSLDMEAYMQYTYSTALSTFVPDIAYYYDDYSFWNTLVPLAGLQIPAQHINAHGLLTGTAMSDYAGNIIVTMTDYDEKGNVTSTVERDLFGQDYAICTNTEYDFTGNPISRSRTTATMVEQAIQQRHDEAWTFTYDRWGRQLETWHKYGNQDWTQLAYNSYNSDGRLAGTMYDFDISNIRSFNYDIRGRLTAISGSRFNEEISYEAPLFEGSTPSFSGNISCINESRYVDGIKSMWQKRFAYDDLGRLESVFDSDSTRFGELYDYDLNGNVTRIVRGASDWHNTTMAFDDISISYDGNNIQSIQDNADDDMFLGEIPQVVSGTYSNAVGYDAMGRITCDDSRGITRILYNPLSLPVRIDMGSDHLVTFTYRADGVKTGERTTRYYTEPVKRYDRNTGDTIIVNRTRSESIYRRYIGALVKESGRPDRIYNEAGYIDINDDSVSYHFYEKDYLGSVRLVVDENGNIEQSVAYTASGLPVSSSALSCNTRLHTGKEYLAFNGLSWYDNNARWYDPILMRFISPDPLAEKYYCMSPYVWCGANPVKFIDYDGKRVKLMGAETDIERVLDIYNSMSEDSPYILNNGYLDIKAGFNPTSTMDKVLCKIIVSDDYDVQINVVSEDENVIIGDVNTATIDVQDMENLKGYKYCTPFSSLFHETFEQSKIQSPSYNPNDEYRIIRAHNSAEGIENYINGTPDMHRYISEDRSRLEFILNNKVMESINIKNGNIVKK